MHPYLNRRQTLQNTLAPGIIILPTAPIRARNSDCAYPYRFDSSFYYLTGFTEPEAIFVQIIGDKPQSILFCRDKHLEHEIWEGYRCGPKAAMNQFGFDEAYSFDLFEEKFIELLHNQSRLYTSLGEYPEFDSCLINALNHVRKSARNGTTVPTEIIDIRAPIHEMRLIKDAHEIAILKEAARINKEAHCRAMKATKPGLYEYSIEAEILYEYTRQGSRFPAYSTIVAGGANACTLHYTDNTSMLRDGDLLLIDAGCEVEGYASDVSRTFPINGRFSGVQKDVYEIVLAAQLAAIDTIKPGNPWHQAENAALQVLAQGLIDLKLCQGSANSVIESGAYRQFYMHKIGHWMGLDVHDTGHYKIDGQWRTLAQGMVTTIEPGLYIRPAENVPVHLANIGIRIEDNILVTNDGYDNLTAAIPKTIADVEAMMK